MPIVITPSGEYVDSVTGNPVNTTTPPMDNMAQRLSQGMGQQNLDPGAVVREGELDGMMARENNAIKLQQEINENANSNNPIG